MFLFLREIGSVIDPDVSTTITKSAPIQFTVKSAKTINGKTRDHSGDNRLKWIGTYIFRLAKIPQHRWPPGKFLKWSQRYEIQVDTAMPKCFVDFWSSARAQTRRLES